MSSKGSPRITLRVPEPWHTRMMDVIASNNRHVHEQEWDVSAWILDAIKDKIAHQERAKVQREKRQANRRGRKLARLAELAG